MDTRINPELLRVKITCQISKLIMHDVGEIFYPGE
jgi:hypothetical protein